jgi:hypothetical protein
LGKSSNEGGASAEGLSRLKKELLRSSGLLREGELSTTLEIEIISALTEGPRSIGELVETIFGTKSSSPGFDAHYMRVYRTAQDLAARGYAVRALFGKEKPYRITGYCVERLLSGPALPSPRMVARLDFAAYALTLVLGALMALAGTGVVVLVPKVLLASNSAFFFLLGISSVRMVQTLRRIG